jgi:hypothetical protein
MSRIIQREHRRRPLRPAMPTLLVHTAAGDRRLVEEKSNQRLVRLTEVVRSAAGNR